MSCLNFLGRFGNSIEMDIRLYDWKFRGKNAIPYFKDRYALLLLARFVGENGMSVKELKRSHLRGWLTKPLIRSLCAKRSVLKRAELLEMAYRQQGTVIYKTTTDYWGSAEEWQPGENQQTRRGRSFVVQVNFSSQHNHGYRKIFPNASSDDFGYWGHPVHRGGEYTLAWARVDLEGEVALIEEVQSDWVRMVEDELRCHKQSMQVTDLSQSDGNAPGSKDYEAYKRYCLTLFAEHTAHWQEATLMSAMEVLFYDKGVREIYYHSPEAGNLLKDIEYDAPPRSLYATLPKKMGFQKTSVLPDWIRNRFEGNYDPPTRKMFKKPKAMRLYEKAKARAFAKEQLLLQKFDQKEVYLWHWDLRDKS